MGGLLVPLLQQCLLLVDSTACMHLLKGCQVAICLQVLMHMD